MYYFCNLPTTLTSARLPVFITRLWISNNWRVGLKCCWLVNLDYSRWFQCSVLDYWVGSIWNDWLLEMVLVNVKPCTECDHKQFMRLWSITWPLWRKTFLFFPFVWWQNSTKCNYTEYPYFSGFGNASFLGRHTIKSPSCMFLPGIISLSSPYSLIWESRQRMGD